MKKRGQITVFIVIAIIIIAVVTAVVLISKSKIESDLSKEYFAQSNVRPELENVQEAIINCIDITTQDALEVIGIQGGYNHEPTEFFELGWAFIPYYYKEGAFLMPTREKVTTELESYVNENFKYCLQDINLGEFTLDYKTIKTDTTIKLGTVTFTINLPITIEREKNKIKFETKEHTINQESKLYEILEIAEYITESHKEDPDLICINCVAEMAQEREVFVDMLDFDQQTTTLVVISENKTSTEPYIFEFLNKYTPE